MEPEKGEYGLWYVGTVGFATKEEAQAYIGRGMKHYSIAGEADGIKKSQPSGFLGYSLTYWMAALLCGTVVFGSALWFFNRAPSEEKLTRQAQMAGLLACQEAIVAVAKYGKADYPPIPEMSVTEDEFTYIWTPGSFYLQNGFGVDVPQSAICVVDRKSRSITNLVITGKTIIP